MSDLAAFLTARYDEDEAAAKAATPGKWAALDGGVMAIDSEDWPVTSTETGRDRSDRLHIARWDPARVLREVEAKRKILAWWQRGDPDPDGPAPSPTYENYRKSLPAYQLLLALAAVYSDHDDYRQDWA